MNQQVLHTTTTSDIVLTTHFFRVDEMLMAFKEKHDPWAPASKISCHTRWSWRMLVTARSQQMTVAVFATHAWLFGLFAQVLHGGGLIDVLSLSPFFMEVRDKSGDRVSPLLRWIQVDPGGSRWI